MEYRIIGEPLPVLECTIPSGESIVTERGSMTWMTPNFQMKTSGGGSLGKAFGRMLSGEAIFQNTYTAVGSTGLISFSSSFPGSIRTIQITPDMPVICQKGSFLAAEPSVELSMNIQKNLGAGFLGGEGFIMQKLSGQGLAFIEIDGTTFEYALQPGQSMIVSTGHLAMMDATCTMTVETVKGGAKNMLFGGEGFFHTSITGPGRIILQSMPIQRLAWSISRYLPSGD